LREVIVSWQWLQLSRSLEPQRKQCLALTSIQRGSGGVPGVQQGAQNLSLETATMAKKAQRAKNV
jgi:hypothetical protein